MRYRYQTLDVFTTERFAGNPLAVVAAAETLSDANMQRITREFALSETVFLLPPSNPVATARVRIFTPGRELPFAGHPTIGTAIYLAEARRIVGQPEQEQIVLLEETIGPVRVGVKLRADQPSFAEFDIPKLPDPLDSAPPVDRLAAALGLAPSEIGFENHRPSRYSAGVPFTFVPVADLSAIAQVRPMMMHWTAAFGAGGSVYVYCRETVSTAASFHARMFSPGMGIAEDPATGGAAAAFSAVVHRFDAPKEGINRAVIEQGYEMGRPSTIKLEIVVAAGGQLKAARIGGHAVVVSEGEIEV